MNNSKNFKAKSIKGDDGILLICLFHEGKTSYFRMDSSGNFVLSQREEKFKLPITPQEWTWAKETWGEKVCILESSDEAKVLKAFKQRESWFLKNRVEKLPIPATYTLGDVVKKTTSA